MVCGLIGTKPFTQIIFFVCVGWIKVSYSLPSVCKSWNIEYGVNYGVDWSNPVESWAGDEANSVETMSRHVSRMHIVPVLTAILTWLVEFFVISHPLLSPQMTRLVTMMKVLGVHSTNRTNAFVSINYCTKKRAITCPTKVEHSIALWQIVPPWICSKYFCTSASLCIWKILSDA